MSLLYDYDGWSGALDIAIVRRRSRIGLNRVG